MRASAGDLKRARASLRREKKLSGSLEWSYYVGCTCIIPVPKHGSLRLVMMIMMMNLNSRLDVSVVVDLE
jgi:hypothetical protein